MSRLSLKNIIGRKNDASALLDLLLKQMNTEICIEDENGQNISGTVKPGMHRRQPVISENEILGYVNGDENAVVIAGLLGVLAKKESEKKKLGSEVLNLYQEINLIFNFSEKLAQTIEPVAIAQITLQETVHLLKSDTGIILLLDDARKKLQVITLSGASVDDETALNVNAGVIREIALSGKSEISDNIDILRGTGPLLQSAKSLMYASLKVKHRVMGAVLLLRNNGIQYSAGELKLLTTLALQSSAAIESALLYEKNIREAKESEEAMRRLYEVTGKFVPYEFIESLGHDVITDVKLGDQTEKIVTVLFSDIRDYTTLSEKMTPAENFGFVSSFNAMMGPVIRSHHGFINQYLGDAIMAIFPRNASDALSAAIEMQKKVREFNKERELTNRAPIQIGIGIHTGPLIMGITGDNERMDATTISDAVNTASRLESLTKYYKGNIIISEATLQHIDAPGNFHFRHLGLVQPKGKLAALSIHECFDGNTESDIARKLTTLEVFNKAMNNYLNKFFSEAVSDFYQVLESHPEDLTARLFAGNARRYMSNGVPENWTGVEEMRSK